MKDENQLLFLCQFTDYDNRKPNCRAYPASSQGDNAGLCCSTASRLEISLSNPRSLSVCLCPELRIHHWSRLGAAQCCCCRRPSTTAFAQRRTVDYCYR